MSNDPVDIVFVCWERPAITELAIKAIKRNTFDTNYRLIVLDNGSQQEQKDMLGRLHDNGYIDELVLLDKNYGLEYARNRGLDLVKSDLFICADNDCIPQPIDTPYDWIEYLIDLMELYPLHAAISCRTQVMIGTGNIFEEADEAKGAIPLVDFPHPGGSLRIMRTDLVRKVGGWRDDNPGRGAEERYICGKLIEAGYRTGFASDVRALHLFGVREHDTDRWGYPKDWEPEVTGHSDIWHPALSNGDDFEQVKEYVGEEYAIDYFKAG